MDPITLALLGVFDGSCLFVAPRSFEKLPIPCPSLLRKSRRRSASRNWPHPPSKVDELLRQNCGLRRPDTRSYQSAVSAAAFGDCVLSDDGLVEWARSDRLPFLRNLASFITP